MFKVYWKLEWNVYCYIFFVIFVGWLICLLIGFFFKLGNGLLELFVMELDIDGVVFGFGDGVFIVLIGFVGVSWLFIWLFLFMVVV